MTHIRQSRLQSALRTRAKFSRNGTASPAEWWAWCVRKWKARHHPGLKSLDAHLARDIGLSQGDLAKHQHKWPSQTTHHPHS